MKTIFISATMSDSGQSLMAWLLARELTERGVAVGLFRPMGVAGPGGGDPLVDLVFDALGNKVAGSRVCPVTVDPEGGVDPDLVEFHINKIQDAFSGLKDKCDVCLAIGSRDVFHDAEHSSLPDSRFIEMFDAKVVLIDRFVKKAMTVYSVLALSSYLKDRLAGMIINRVPDADWEEFSTKTAPYLRDKGAPIFAALPEDDIIISPTITDVSELLGAKIIGADCKSSVLVTGKTISPHDLPRSLSIFKRVTNKIVMMGGPEPAIAQSEPSKPCAIAITGGREPAKVVVDAAEKEGIPLLLTSFDTFDAVNKIENEKIYIKPRDTFRIERLKLLLEKEISMHDLLAACGV